MDQKSNASDKKKIAKVILTQLNTQKAKLNESLKKKRKEGNSFFDIGRNYRYL